MKAIYLDEAIERFNGPSSSLSKDQIIYMLERMPYTEIVRCRDCRHKYVKDMSAYHGGAGENRRGDSAV